MHLACVIQENPPNAEGLKPIVAQEKLRSGVGMCMGGASEALRFAPFQSKARNQKKPSAHLPLAKQSTNFATSLGGYVVANFVNLLPEVGWHRALPRRMCSLPVLALRALFCVL